MPDSGSESDLPSADSGETFSDVNSLKERLSGDTSGTDAGERSKAEEGKDRAPSPTAANLTALKRSE